ncbi:hypothetical protein AD998_13790 [bacterium 336/3]|nr:hypothetical protein AD998_13790 [bacterium 336/3]
MLSASGRKTLIQNFLALAIIQGTNFLLPLILMPYLNSSIGIDRFGVVSLIQTVMIFLGTFTDFGFNLSATREISIHKNNAEHTAFIFNKVIVIKLLLCLVAFIVLMILALLIPKFYKDFWGYILGFSIVLGQVLLPVWFFQGIEKMKYLTYLNVIAKIVFTILIFVFVKQPDDYLLVLLFFGLGNIVSGILGILLAYKQLEKPSLKLPSKTIIQKELKDGWHLFVANFSIMSYIHSNLLILSLFANDYILGIYSIAEKTVLAMRQILVVLSQAIYPKICQFAQESHQGLRNFYKKLFIPFFGLYLVFSCSVFLFADFTVFILAKKHIPEATHLLRLLCFTPFIVGLNIPAYQTLLAYEHQKSYMMILSLGSLLSVFLNLGLSWAFQADGTAISIIITETFITIGLHWILHKNHPKERLFA